MDYLIILNVIGVVAFSLSGYIASSQEKLDILGVFTISFITALGGGIIRDILISIPPSIFKNSQSIIIILITLIGAYSLKLHQYSTILKNKLFLIADNIGLNIFAINGAIIAINNDFNFFGIIFLALITSVGGGVIRDIILNKIPYVFKFEFYGSISIIIGSIIYFLNTYKILNNFMISILLIVGIIIRLFAIKYDWKLPRI